MCDYPQSAQLMYDKEASTSRRSRRLKFIDKKNGVMKEE